MTKKELKEKIYLLKKWGYTFKNFQDFRRAAPGSKGFTDLLIIAPTGEIFFIDIKTENDKPSKEQLEFREIIKTRCKYAYHLFLTPDNHIKIIDTMLSKRYGRLEEIEEVKIKSILKGEMECTQ